MLLLLFDPETSKTHKNKSNRRSVVAELHKPPPLQSFNARKTPDHKHGTEIFKPTHIPRSSFLSLVVLISSMCVVPAQCLLFMALFVLFFATHPDELIKLPSFPFLDQSIYAAASWRCCHPPPHLVISVYIQESLSTHPRIHKLCVQIKSDQGA